MTQLQRRRIDRQADRGQPGFSPCQIVGMRTALAHKDVVDGLATFGLEAMSSTPAELADLVKRDTAKWAPIAKAVGFTAEG